ncbi:MAG TPA: hypothetical protein VKT49_00620 [Bryobacteraceae bacterium]|nr:hypothetical protein [Bryobacteraceae bacterium]
MQSRLLLVTAAIAALSFGQAARKPGAPTKAWQAPRTPDGVADIQGFWNNSTLTPLERPKALGTKEFYTEEEFAELSRRVREGKIGAEADLGAAAEQTLRYDLSLYGFDITKATFASNRRTSLIVGPEGVVPPMLPQARKRNADRAAKNKGHEFDSYENRPLQERCILLGQERIPMLSGPNDNNELQIVQGRGWVVLLHEINHDTRVIPTDGRPHIAQRIRQYQGDSVGHWEGDTLVVDTTNFMDIGNFRGSGEKLHLIERFTRTAENTLLYGFTVEDPETWATPWTAEVPMTRSEGPVYEWACHEGNTMISTILNGARVAEAEAAKKGK